MAVVILVAIGWSGLTWSSSLSTFSLPSFFLRFRLWRFCGARTTVLCTFLPSSLLLNLPFHHPVHSLSVLGLRSMHRDNSGGRHPDRREERNHRFVHHLLSSVRRVRMIMTRGGNPQYRRTYATGCFVVFVHFDASRARLAAWSSSMFVHFDAPFNLRCLHIRDWLLGRRLGLFTLTRRSIQVVSSCMRLVAWSSSMSVRFQLSFVPKV